MSYYRVCPLCGAALDPGERCDCQDKEEAALGVSSTQGGMVEQVLTAKFPPPILHEKTKNARRFA